MSIKVKSVKVDVSSLLEMREALILGRAAMYDLSSDEEYSHPDGLCGYWRLEQQIEGIENMLNSFSISYPSIEEVENKHGLWRSRSGRYLDL